MGYQYPFCIDAKSRVCILGLIFCVLFTSKIRCTLKEFNKGERKEIGMSRRDGVGGLGRSREASFDNRLTIGLPLVGIRRTEADESVIRWDAGWGYGNTLTRSSFLGAKGGQKVMEIFAGLIALKSKIVE
jgi:hypothetical protein